MPTAILAIAAAVVKGPSPERVAQLGKTIDKTLEQTAAALAGAIDQLARDNVTVPLDVARATCAALGDTDTRKNLAEAWAPLIAELAPVDGPPSPYVSAVVGSLAFAISVTATTFAIRNQREQVKPS
jgi:predicted RNase H-like HicB family nuclease